MVTLDMEVAFEDGEFELVLLDEANERELEASEPLSSGASTLESLCQTIQLMIPGIAWRSDLCASSGTSVKECST